MLDNKKRAHDLAIMVTQESIHKLLNDDKIVFKVNDNRVAFDMDISQIYIDAYEYALNHFEKHFKE